MMVTMGKENIITGVNMKHLQKQYIMLKRLKLKGDLRE